MTIIQEINTPRVSNPTAGGGICLNMIVKNEVKILERCLASVAPWISYYVIGDTGSTDGTQDLIRAFFDERGIKGEIHEYEFENYSQARNRALEFCKASTGKFETILFIDADMELKVDDPAIFLNSPTAGGRRCPPVASVRQSNSELDYENVRLLNRSIEAKYEGYTHEYLSTPLASLPVGGIWFLDHACGSNRGEKSVRDARLLEASLLENPNNVRSMFYLAQTYKDMGEWGKAVAWYLKRKQAGGWDEEVWYATYMMAGCYKGLGDEAKFIAQNLEAYQLRPNRAEPLHALANFYRNAGKNELALIISEAGKKIPYPNDKLFVEHNIYAHGFDEEIQIAGFYCQNSERKKAGHDACMRLSTDRKVPEHVRRNAISNSGFYARSAKELFPSFEAHELPLMIEPDKEILHSETLLHHTWHSMNPSVAVDDNDVHCIVRTVNYTLTPDGQYPSPDGIIRTRNFHLRWGVSAKRVKSKQSVSSAEKKSSKISRTAGTAACVGLSELFKQKPQVQEIIDIQSEKITDFPVKGYEDCRLFKWQKDWWCGATVRDRHPQGVCEIVLFNPRTREEHVIRDFEPEKYQKNWVPLVTQFDQLLFVYMADPTIILEIDPLTLACKKKTESDPIFALSHLRGGSQAIPWRVTDKIHQGPPGWIYVTHEVIGEHGGRKYLHRFVVLDSEFKVQKVSDSFYFLHQGVEFCAGLARKDDKLLISFGVKDSQAFIASVLETEVHDFL